MKGPFTTLCFSGECGFCEQCSSSLAHLPRKDEPGIPISDHCLTRAEDNLKIISPELYNKKCNTYHKRLKSLSIRDQTYVQDVIPKKCELHESVFGEPSVYTRIEGTHGAVCDDMYCKMMFTQSDDGTKALKYTGIPMYTRSSDDGCQLCAVCITKYPGYAKI